MAAARKTSGRSRAGSRSSSRGARKKGATRTRTRRSRGSRATSRSTAKRKTSSKRSTRSTGRSRSTGGRKYGPKAQQKVEKVMRERKRGTLRSGGSGRKVTSRKQAIAIGLSEARRAGAKVPSPRGRSRKK